jgi:C-terminal domain of 1-Cys peroxiredoxin
MLRINDEAPNFTTNFAGHRQFSRMDRQRLGHFVFAFDEVLRVLDSTQLTAKHQVSTPVNWKPGEDVIISGRVSDEDTRKKFPGGWKAALSTDRSAAEAEARN